MPESPNPSVAVTEIVTLDEGGFNLPATHVIDQEIPIVDGRVKIFIPRFNCNFDIRVKQVKGRGAYYMDKIHKPSKAHFEIVTLWIQPMNVKKVMAIDEIFEMIKQKRFMQGQDPPKAGPTQSRISELFRKEIVLHVGKKWSLNVSEARKMLLEGKF